MSTTYKDSNSGDRLDSERMSLIKDLTVQLAEREYPRVWIGEPGMTPAQLLADQNFFEEERRDAWEKMTRQERKEILEETPEDLREHVSDEMLMQPPQEWEDLPQQLRERLRHGLEVDPGEFVEIEGTGMGLEIPKVSYEYLDGLWVVLKMPDALDEGVLAELASEVRYIYAAKHDEVVIEEDSWERYVKRIAPDYRHVPIDDLTPEDLEKVNLEEMELYVTEWEPMGPYIMEDSEAARRAVDERLDS